MSNWNVSHFWTIVKHRQRTPNDTLSPVLRSIREHFLLPNISYDRSPETFIYFSQISQAIALKMATERFRVERWYRHTMGAIYWQLNDVWAANTASVIDVFGVYKVSSL